MQGSLFDHERIVHRTPTLTNKKQSDNSASMFSSMEEDEDILFGS